MSNVEALLKACRIGDEDSVHNIISSFPHLINESDSKLGWTGLYCSVMCGHIEIVKYLISNSADINIQNRMGETPLHQAIECRNLKIVKILLKNQADPNIQQNDGETPLHIAISQLNYKAVVLLLQHSASPNIPNKLYGKTPVHYAVECGNSRIYNEITKFGADLSVKDKQGYSPENLKKIIEKQITAPLSVTQQISPSLTRCNSESSTLNEKKSIDSSLKQIQSMHQMIKETVRASVDTIKKVELSQGSSENDGKKVTRTAPTELNPELFNWLKSIRLSSEYETLVNSGYDDLRQLVKQMKSNLPINEKILMKNGVKKIGHRRRMLANLYFLARKEVEPGILNSFQCCISISRGLWSGGYLSLEKWLKDIGLNELEPVFKKAGFEEVEDLAVLEGTPWEIDDVCLGGIGIEKPGYRHRILAKLKESNAERKSAELVIEKTSNGSACTLCNVM